MSDPYQDPRYRPRSHHPPGSSQTTNQSAYSGHSDQPVYTPYPSGTQEPQLAGHSGSYPTSTHALGGHTPHVPFPEPPQEPMSFQFHPAEHPETYSSHSSTSYSTPNSYGSADYRTSSHAQGGYPPHSSFPGQPQSQSVPRQSEPRGPPANYLPSQTSPHLAGANPQGSYGSGGYQPAGHAQGGYTSDPSYPGQPHPPRSTPLQHSHSSAGPPVPYFSSPPTTPYSTAGPHQQGGQDLRRYPHTGGSSGSQNMSMYEPGSSAAGQLGGTAGTGSGNDPESESGYRNRGPPASATHPSACRFSGCFRQTFFDRRVNEFREWCSDQHMRDAITSGMEMRCKQCNVWPRRNGAKYCSGDVCKNPGIF